MPGDISTSTALVFPGMAPSPYSDVAKFMLLNPVARRLLARAEAVLGYDLLKRFRAAGEDYSEYSQVAFLVNCLASAYWSRDVLEVRAGVCAGASFGGKAAAVFSGALSFEDAVLMTARMARCEAEYFAAEHTDLVTVSFARVPADQLDVLLGELDERGEWHDISCYIDDGFFMVSLRETAAGPFRERIRDLGGLPIYTMRPPMHSALLRPLMDRVEREVFPGVRLTDPALPVVADQSGSVLRTAAEVRATLLHGYVAPVRWPDVVATLRRLGVERVVVAGPDILFGRVDCTIDNFDVLPVSPRTLMQPRDQVAV
jgi:[acyl-carrier-protein] S-malonyltransferase